MDGELVRLTGTEWAVLDCLWEASPQTMTQLAHTLAGREGWAKGTTTTVLKRMTEKGLLTCQQGERAKWYAPAVERRAAVVSETRSFLRRICRESVSVLTNAAAEPERLSREEIDALYDGETCHCAATDDGAMEADGSILCEVAALNDTDPATPLMLYAEDYYAGCPAVAVHAFGKGQAYYLASRFNADFYNDFYAQVCEKAGLQPAWPEQLPAGVLATRRGDFVFMQNCNDHSVDIDGVELEKYSTRLVQLEPVDEDDES